MFLILSFVFPGLFMAVVSVALDSHGNTMKIQAAQR